MVRPRISVVVAVAFVAVGAHAEPFGPVPPTQAPHQQAEPAELPAEKRAELPASESLPLGEPRQQTKSVEPAEPAPTKGLLSGTIPALLGVIAVAIGLAALLRKAASSHGGVASALGAGGKAPSGLLEVLGRYPVGRGSTLVLLRMDRRVLLLNQSAGGRWGGARFSTLAEVTDAEEVASILIKAGESENAAARAQFEQSLREFERSAPVDGEPVTEIHTEPGAVDSLRRRLDTLRVEGRA